ncbi:TPA: hypothetical protein QFD82_002274, partial [Enterococcus faecium]
MLEYSGFFIKAVTLKKDIIIVLFFLLLLIGRFILIHYSPLPIIKEKNWIRVFKLHAKKKEPLNCSDPQKLDFFGVEKSTPFF